MKTLSWLLILTGVLVVAFSEQIVFPGLETILGIETIVGPDNVSYDADGGYVFTNPTAMIRWIACVVAVGLAIVSTGVVGLIRSRKRRRCQQRP
jgi:hypothetical protein